MSTQNDPIPSSVEAQGNREQQPRYIPRIPVIDTAIDGELQVGPEVVKSVFCRSIDRAKSICTIPTDITTGPYDHGVTSVSYGLPYRTEDGQDCVFRLCIRTYQAGSFQDDGQTWDAIGLLIERVGQVPTQVIEFASHGLERKTSFTSLQQRKNNPEDLQSMLGAMEAFDGQKDFPFDPTL